MISIQSFPGNRQWNYSQPEPISSPAQEHWLEYIVRDLLDGLISPDEALDLALKTAV